MTYILRPFAPMPARVGRYQLANRPTVERGATAFVHGTETAPPSYKLIQQVSAGFRDRQLDVALRLDLSLVPFEVQDLMDRTHLIADLTDHCRALVFCTHLTTAASGEPVPGFLVDQVGETCGESNPFSFIPADLAGLTPPFLAEPARAIFLNCSNPAGALLTPRELLPNLAYFIGYLKAGAELALDQQNPSRFELLDYYAEQYRGQHLSNVMEEVRPS